MNLKKSNYKEQKGCHNCGSCFIKEEYDELNYYYCNSDNSKRPLCGSVFMHEIFQGIPNIEMFRKSRKIWEAWTLGRKVFPWGICDKWSKSTKMCEEE